MGSLNLSEFQEVAERFQGLGFLLFSFYFYGWGTQHSEKHHFSSSPLSLCVADSCLSDSSQLTACCCRLLPGTMTTLDDKLLGEKLQYYYSSSEEEDSPTFREWIPAWKPGSSGEAPWSAYMTFDPIGAFPISPYGLPSLYTPLPIHTSFICKWGAQLYEFFQKYPRILYHSLLKSEAVSLSWKSVWSESQDDAPRPSWEAAGPYTKRS